MNVSECLVFVGKSVSFYSYDRALLVWGFHFPRFIKPQQDEWMIKYYLFAGEE